MSSATEQRQNCPDMATLQTYINTYQHNSFNEIVSIIERENNCELSAKIKRLLLARHGMLRVIRAEENILLSIEDDEDDDGEYCYADSMTDFIDEMIFYSKFSFNKIISIIEDANDCRFSDTQKRLLLIAYTTMRGVFDSSLSTARSSCSTISDSQIIGEARKHLETDPNPDDLSSWNMVKHIEVKFNCEAYSSPAERNRVMALIDSVFDPYIKAKSRSVSGTSLTGKVCHKDLTGNNLNGNLDNIITFLLPGRTKSECITVDDLHRVLDRTELVCLWEPYRADAPSFGQALKYAPVYKLPYSGVFVQSTIKYLTIFKCFRLTSIGKRLIGSAFGVFALHGVEEEIFVPTPIHYADLKAFAESGTAIPAKSRLEGPFIPVQDDLMAHKNLAGNAFISTFNGHLIVQDMITGEFKLRF